MVSSNFYFVDFTKTVTSCNEIQCPRLQGELNGQQITGLDPFSSIF